MTDTKLSLLDIANLMAKNSDIKVEDLNLGSAFHRIFSDHIGKDFDINEFKKYQGSDLQLVVTGNISSDSNVKLYCALGNSNNQSVLVSNTVECSGKMSNARWVINIPAVQPGDIHILRMWANPLDTDVTVNLSAELYKKTLPDGYKTPTTFGGAMNIITNWVRASNLMK